jgi:glycosyltransferase involved in cell wall biosynthesis
MKIDALISKKNIKIVKLSGGLGNQLFQYLFACATFKDSTDCIIFDVSDYFNGLAKRNFVLEKLGLQGSYATCLKTIYSVQGVQYVDLTILSTFGSKNIRVGDTLQRVPLITEKEIRYTPLKEYDLSQHAYIEGYWQSYRYWADPINYARNYFEVLHRRPQTTLSEMADIIPRSATDVCAIHFRRGDYDTEFNDQYHGKCESHYFFQAMRLSGAKQFHVYSDDIAAAQGVFSQFENVRFFGGATSDEIADFISLMDYSQLIISNSSYSYLAAYCAFAAHQATVIAPYPWYSFKDVGPDIPNEWLRLNRTTGSTSLEDAKRINEAKISVIIPVHVRHQYLRHAVASVLEQSVKATEIILSLNGASDRARNEANLLASLHGNIRIVEATRSSLSLARNNGIRAAIGEYIAFLDDDDIWETTKLEAQISAAIRTSAALVATNYYKFDEVGHKYYVSSLSSNLSNVWKYELSIANHLSGGSAVLVRRDVFNTVGFFDESMPSCEDHDMWRRISIAGYKIHFVEDCLVGYRTNADNMTSKPTLMLQGELIHLSKILNEGPLYTASARKFYERIEVLLAQHFETPSRPMASRSTADALDASKAQGALASGQSRFYYLRRLRQILSTGKLSETVKHFFLKPHPKRTSVSITLVIQSWKAVKIFFLALPFEMISYLFYRFKNIFKRSH